MTEITWPTPFGYTVFCDDVRLEVLNKQTYVGVYNGEMSVVGTLPVVVTKLMLAVHYFEKPEDGREPLQLRVFLPGDPEDAPSQSLDIPPREYPLAPNHDDELRGSINLVLGFAPLTIKEAGKITVRMKKGDDVVRLGSLNVKVITQEEAQERGWAVHMGLPNPQPQT